MAPSCGYLSFFSAPPSSTCRRLASQSSAGGAGFPAEVEATVVEGEGEGEAGAGEEGAEAAPSTPPRQNLTGVSLQDEGVKGARP
jgi:hypothetical protein